jgi:hypothetical protein
MQPLADVACSDKRLKMQKSMFEIWQVMIKSYGTVVDEPMSDVQREDRAETKKQFRIALKEYEVLL